MFLTFSVSFGVCGCFRRARLNAFATLPVRDLSILFAAGVFKFILRSTCTRPIVCDTRSIFARFWVLPLENLSRRISTRSEVAAILVLPSWYPQEHFHRLISVCMSSQPAEGRFCSFVIPGSKATLPNSWTIFEFAWIPWPIWFSPRRNSFWGRTKSTWYCRWSAWQQYPCFPEGSSGCC